ncbi:MAG: acyl-CoA dehydrogenase [Bacillus thermozeamaize]|jgi:alkylation response protein AidB-like acyl-CoA dehydrogenase|uniref:Acyl-CoA dehydrogenase n=1 Tax=Bacillus thermozeamaize TaxID=230954 RepID=A0A1Y3PHL7_9BACI|nr:MAG: acyl-CoA dehydrogenase [Bacillus thermozeamaize]
MPYPPYFTEEHDAFREEIRHFFATEVAPYAPQWEEQGYFPLSILRRMGELGYLGLSYPVEVGGRGGDYFMSVVMAEEKARCGAGGFGMAIAVQTDMATPPIYQFGTPEQIERFLKPAIRGEKLACLGITEPNHGSDVQSIETRAYRDGDEWVINGSKLYITNGPRADFITLVARTSDAPGYKGISLFLVELDRPGVSVAKVLDKVGMRSSDTAELVFDNVRVPHENLLGEEGKGFYQIMWELQGERVISAAGSVGSAQYAFELACSYAQGRAVAGKPLIRNQVIRHMLAEMATEIEAVRQMVYATAYRFARKEATPWEISMAKLAASQLAHKVIDQTLQIHGGNGYTMDYPVERMWRDSRLPRIGAGTDEIMKEIIAKGLHIIER